MRISAYTLYFKKLESLAYIFDAACMGRLPISRSLCICAKHYENWLAVDKVIAKIIRLTFLAHPVYFEKLESLAYIFVAACMGQYLHSNVCSGLQKTHLFCIRVRFDRSSSFRVIQGRWFWYQSKARIRFPISRSLWLLSYLVPFSRYGDLLAKNCLFLLYIFATPLSFGIRRPRSLCSPWNFAAKLALRKLESWGYPPVKTVWS